MSKNIYLSIFILSTVLISGCGGESKNDSSTQKEVSNTAKSASNVAAKAVNAAVAEGSGTLKGIASFAGVKPTPSAISMGADPTCSSIHTEKVYTEDVVGNGQNLKNVFVYIKTGLEGKSFQTPTQTAILDQKGCVYNPHVLGVQVNQPLEIINSDATLHNVHGMPKETKEFNLGMPVKGMKIKRKFSAPEVMVKFKCDVHPWMSAYVGVLNHPFFAVTDANGSFQMKDVPAGKYTLVAWHEKFGVLEKEVIVAAEGILSTTFEFQA